MGEKFAEAYIKGWVWIIGTGILIVIGIVAGLIAVF